MFVVQNKTYKSFSFILKVVLNACLGAFANGYTLGELNLLLVDLKHIYSWSEFETSFYTGLLNALLPLGTIIAAIISGNYFQRIGRKWSLVIADLLGILGAITCIFIGSNAYPQIIGRILSGMSVGINIYNVPLYINELTPKEISGLMGCLYQTLQCLGLMTGYLMALNIPNDSSDYDIEDNWWKFVISFAAVPCFIRCFFLLLVFKFDTPFSLMQRNKDQEVSEIIKKIYKEEFIEDIINNIDIKIKSYKNVTYKQLFSSYRSRMLLAFILIAVSQLSGFSAVLSESSVLYSAVGNENEVKLLTIFNSLVLIIVAIFSGPVSDKYGRKSLMIYGNFSCFILLCLMGISQEFTSTTMAEVSVYLTYLFLSSYGYSLGPILCFYIPEIIPDKGIGLMVIFSSIFQILVLFLTPIFTELFGISTVYFFYALCLLCAQPLLKHKMIETKGKCQAEIEELFEENI